jgi:hypothetical protein
MNTQSLLGEENMKMKFHNATLALVVTAGILPALSVAQNLTGRTTNMNWTSLYGGGPTSSSPFGNFSDASIQSNFSKTMSFSDSKSGDFPLPWTAFVEIEFNQQFSVTGPLNNFSQIQSSMSGSKSQGASGIGAAGIQSVLPGNELIMEFTVANTMNYNLAGSWMTDADNTSQVKLDRKVGQDWANIHSSLFLFQGSNGAFNWTGQLTQGTYRIYSQNELLNGFNSFEGGHNYTFTNLDAVPEPGTMLALSALAIAAARRRKQI